jgi:hypothetical protein
MNAVLNAYWQWGIGSSDIFTKGKREPGTTQ